MLTAVEVYVSRAEDMSPIDATIVFRGTDTSGVPFYDAITEVDVEDITTTIQTELLSNAVQWGVTDDIS